MVVFVLIFCPMAAWAQSLSCDDFKVQSQPQRTPDGTYQFELDMMKQGAYCYNLAIFDPEWQGMSQKNATGSQDFKRIAGYFDVPSKTYQEGKYAIIYYPDHPTLGPVFLYRENGVWIIDRTSVWKYIHYEDAWLAYDGNYPYLEMLKTLFRWKNGTPPMVRRLIKSLHQARGTI